MKKQIGTLAAVCFVLGGMIFAGQTTAAAQGQAAEATTPPTILAINREFVKPTAIGSVHEKSESALAQAMQQANSPDHYTAWVAITGPSRVLFASGYDSYADYEKAVQRMFMGNSAEAQAFDRLQRADGNLLTKMDSVVFRFQPDMSVNPAVDIARMRYVEITGIHIRPGHDADWRKLAKLHNSVFASVPGAHWAMYEGIFGTNGGVYLAISPMKSLAELDASHAAMAKAWAAAGADDKKNIRDLEASTFESIESNLYAVDPKMSYPADSWKAADPGFWKQ